LNNFYKLNVVLQWTIAIVMVLLLLSVVAWWFKLCADQAFLFLLIFVITPLLQFLMTPFFTLIGLYKYVSPMLLVYNGSNKKYDLHNGTSFDYLFVMRNTKVGIGFRQKMLTFYLDGLLAVIDKIEDKSLAETVVVRGSSYFFTERTATRLGFKISKTNAAEKTNLVFNYLDLLWMYSLSKGKLVFPNLNKIKTAEISGKKLLVNKKKLLVLKSFLHRNQNI